MTTEATKDLELGVQHREFRLERGAVGENRTITFPCSSEEPYRRYDYRFGGEYVEILDHSPSAVRLERFNDGAPFLKDHWREKQIGVVEKGELVGRRLVATTRFGNSQLALDEEKDVDDGIRQKVSVGYIVHEMRLDVEHDDGPDEYRVTDWEPLETSTVAIPADSSVGIGRSEAEAAYQHHRTRVIGCPRGAARERESGGNSMATATTTTRRKPDGQDQVDELNSRSAVELERDRCLEIKAIGDRFDCRAEAEDAIRAGTSSAAFRARVWERQPEGGPLDAGATHPGQRSTLGLFHGRDLEGFSLTSWLRRAADGKGNEKSLETEVSDHLEKETGQEIMAAGTLLLPDEWFAPLVAKRDIEYGGTASGTAAVGTNLLSGNFVEALRNKAMVLMLGARMLTGLVGNVSVPRQAAAGQFTWLAEGDSVVRNELSLDAIALSPKTVAGAQLATRRMFLQSTPSIDGLIRADLVNGMAVEIDRVAINGGLVANEPNGILQLTPSSVVYDATTGLTERASLMALVTAVADLNADNSSQGFLTSPSMRGRLKSTPVNTNAERFIWEDERSADFGNLLGWRAAVTNNVPKDLGVGNDEHLTVFGSWDELLIGAWGVPAVQLDPFSAGDQGALIMRLFHDIDLGVRHTEAFAVTQTIP